MTIKNCDKCNTCEKPNGDCSNPIGLKICNQPYALCSKAFCEYDKITNQYICKCENFNGCSMGTKECSELAPYIDEHGKNVIFSTFSPEYGKLGYTLNIDNAKSWANCLNMKCEVDPTDKTKSTCYCEVASGLEVTYNDTKLQDVSGVSYEGFLQTAQFWERCLGENLLKINQEAYEKKNKK